MDEPALRRLLGGVVDGSVTADEAVTRLRRLPFGEVAAGRVDHHRALRTGLPEAVYSPGKTPEQCVQLVGELLAEEGGPVLLTRADTDQVDAVLAAHPDGIISGVGPHLVVWRQAAPGRRRAAVVSAGTADGPVAEEAATTLEALGVPVTRLADVGVAGLHRLLADVDTVTGADAVVVVAGMEGALASVVGGLTAAPVVAVPTSVGYGSSLEGVTALLAMLSSCAAGIAVVGIDNGYGAACAVRRLLGSEAERE